MPDTQPVHTEVPFEFFDKPRKLRFHYDEYLELEARSGRTPMEFVANIMKLSSQDLRLALWIGLKWEEAGPGKKTVTQEWIGKQLQKHMASGKSLMTILRVLDEAFSASGYFTPEEKVDEEDAENPTRPGATEGGSSSSRHLQVAPVMPPQPNE